MSYAELLAYREQLEAARGRPIRSVGRLKPPKPERAGVRPPEPAELLPSLDFVPWFREPLLYIRELAELGQKRFVVYRRTAVQRNWNAFFDTYCGADSGWKALLLADQGAAEIDHDHDHLHPRAVYPVFSPRTQDPELLVRYCRSDVGQDRLRFGSATLHVSEKPIRGQPHVVVIRGAPNRARYGAFTQMLMNLRQAYPSVRFHSSNVASYPFQFSGQFSSGDFDPRFLAFHRQLKLPNGVDIDPRVAGDWSFWIRLLNYSPSDLKKSRDFCLYNIRSYLWAAQYWNSPIRMRVRTLADDEDMPDGFTPQRRYHPPGTSTAVVGGPGRGSGRWKATDKITCDTCSLAPKCKLFRKGAVCGLTGSDGKSLADLFGTRDQATLVEAMHKVLSLQATRLENAIIHEEPLSPTGGMDPEITKLAEHLLRGGERLIRIANPQLPAGVNVNVLTMNPTSGPGRVAAGGHVAVQPGEQKLLQPKEVVAAAIWQIEQSGISREQITADMVTAHIHSQLDIVDGQLQPPEES